MDAASSLEKDIADPENICNLCSIPATLRCGSEFHLSGNYKDPMSIIKSSNSFNGVITVVKQLKCEDNDVDNDDFERNSKRDAEVNEIRQNAAEAIETEAKAALERQCCEMLKDIGPPWNWLHNFTSHNCFAKSYNFIEQISVASDMTLDDDMDGDMESTDDSLDVSSSTRVSTGKQHTTDDVQSSTSGKSSTQDDTKSTKSNEHKVLVDTICQISEAIENCECVIQKTSSIASVLDTQYEKKQLNTADYERLKKFIDRALENGLVFNDLNELYNYFIQESSRDSYMNKREMEANGDAEVENSIQPSTSLSAGKKHKRKETEAEKSNNENSTTTADGKKNVEAIFGESGIEVDNKLLESKVSERMILGLVDKTQSDVDNISDVASSNASISSLSNAETVKMKENINVTREKDTQTMSYQERMHEKRMQSGQRKSSSFAEERQPFTCKIPKLPGIGVRLSDERIEKILKFITNRSFEQGGFVYPRNFLEDDCPSLTELS